MGGIIPGFAATGQTGLYYQLISATTGQIANGSGVEIYNQAHWANYVIAAPEQAGSGRYVVGFPGYLPADRYLASLYTPLGGSPASGDTPTWSDFFDWDGSNILGYGSSVNVGRINNSAVAAMNLALSANAYVVGAAAAGTLSTSQMTTNLSCAVANQYAGRILMFTSGTNAGRAALITAYAVTGGKLTFIAYGNQPISSAPAASDAFIII